MRNCKSTTINDNTCLIHNSKSTMINDNTCSIRNVKYNNKDNSCSKCNCKRTVIMTLPAQ